MKNKLPKTAKVSLLLVISLVAVCVCIMIMQDRTLKKYSLDSIIVDQFEPESVIIYTGDFSGYEIMRAGIIEETKNYDKFIQSDDLVGRKIKIYYSGEILALAPVSFAILAYELGEKASPEEMKEALDFYNGPERDMYETHAKQKEEWENNNK